MSTGVIKELTIENRSYYTATDIMKILDVSQSKAYTMIRDMRDEMIANGKLAKQYPSGKIPKKCFDELCMIK